MTTSRAALWFQHEIRGYAPASLHPADGTWPEPITFSHHTLRHIASEALARVNLSDPLLAQTAFDHLHRHRNLVAQLAFNTTAPALLRRLSIATAEHRARIAIELAEITDAELADDLATGTVAPYHLELLLHARPHLIAGADTWHDANRRGLLSSVLCPEEVAAALLASAQRLTSSRDREIWDRIASSPVLPVALRAEALARREGKWRTDKHLTARIAAESVPTLAWPWTPERLDELAAPQFLGLVRWADGSWAQRSGLTAPPAPRPPLGIAALTAHPRGQAAMAYLRSAPNRRTATPRSYLPITEDLTGAISDPMTRLVAALTWSTPTATTAIAPEDLSNWTLAVARTVTARHLLGEHQGRWETLFGLVGEWDGTWGELVLAARSLG